MKGGKWRRRREELCKEGNGGEETDGGLREGWSTCKEGRGVRERYTGRGGKKKDIEEKEKRSERRTEK